MGFSKNIGDFVHLFLSQLTSSAVEVDLGDLADQDCESSTDSLDDTESESDLVFSSHVGILHTQQVREVIGFLKY